MSRTEQVSRAVHFEFRAMNTNIDVQLFADREQAEHAATLVKSWFEMQEQRFSRFVADSELNRLNHSRGWMPVSAAMDEVLSLAYGYIGQTEGIFQPGISKALRLSKRASHRLLLDRLIGARKMVAVSAEQETLDYSRPTWIQREGSRMVHLDPGTEIDLGGIVKGWAVERVADWLQQKMKIDAGMINAGGDVQVWGTADHPYWTLEVTSPIPHKQDLSGKVRIRNGAVATSGISPKQEECDYKGRVHHLIDPRTMEPADTDILQCTVVGKHASQCEIVAKTVCILGSVEAVKWLNRHYDRHDVLWITREGQVYFRGNTGTLAECWLGFDPDHRFSLI